jgi:predicted O-methyltransferase YrrM
MEWSKSMSFYNKFSKWFSWKLNKPLAAGRISRFQKQGMPKEFEEPLAFLVRGTLNHESDGISRRIEVLRQKIANVGNETVTVLYSPKPGSSGTTVLDDLRPAHGEKLDFSMEQIAKTGKNRRWGLFLHLLAKNLKSSVMLELGSCIGMSGCYLASVASCRTFITIEGSSELAELARKHIQEFKPDVKVMNMLFDDALDKILPTLDTKIDFLFIDGHHEKIATIHYYDRIKSYLRDDAVVVFDDINWSYDMRDAWNMLSSREEFDFSADFGAVGVCRLNPSNQNGRPTYWDFQKILGKQKIGEPHGWKG